jgi:hypothetical protein
MMAYPSSQYSNSGVGGSPGFGGYLTGGMVPGPGGMMRQYGTGTPQTTTAGAYQTQLDTAPKNYSDISNQIQNQIGQSVFNNPNVSNAISTLTGAVGQAQDFSQTGGFSPQDVSDLRARAISPIRSIYMNAQNDINRQRNLQGGYSPNYTAATAQMARDLSSTISDQTTNANAQLAQMVQQGKLAGLGQLLAGSGNLASTTGSLASGDLSRALQGTGQLTSLFGTSPGMLSTLGNQTLQAQSLADQSQRFIDQLNQQGQLQELAMMARGM